MKQDTNLKILKMLISAEMTVECIDDVKHTNWYNAKVKQHGNILCNVLNPMLKKHLTNLYKEDPEIITNFFRELDALISKLAGLNVVDLAMINQIHDHYSKYPEDWQNVYNLEFFELKQ